ncbi:hypothetical protein LINPERHAP1_LOCUS30135 [Linum perenne]
MFEVNFSNYGACDLSFFVNATKTRFFQENVMDDVG